MEDAERLLNSLTGVLSASMVTDASGEIREIHVVTSSEVRPKQTVRNVESALQAHLGITVDHRKISVAQTDVAGEEDAAELVPDSNGTHGSERLLFLGHEIKNERPHRVRARVQIEWRGESYAGEAAGADLPRSRLDILANAVLQGLETILDPSAKENPPDGTALALDGVKIVDAFDRRYTLVGVHAIHGRDVKVLSGSAPVNDMLDRAVILATLKATDRWVRGRL